MTYGNLTTTVRDCGIHDAPCYVLHCESCGIIGGHYHSRQQAEWNAAGHQKNPHEIKRGS